MSVRVTHFVALLFVISSATGCCSYPCGGCGYGYGGCVDTMGCGGMPSGGLWSRMTGRGGCDACCVQDAGCYGDSFGGMMVGGVSGAGGCAACQGGGSGGIPAGSVIDGGVSTGQVYPGSVIQGDVIPGATFDGNVYGGGQLQPTPAAAPYGTNHSPAPAPSIGISPPPAGSAAPSAPLNAVPAT